MAYNMYVALQDDDKILIMDMDQDTGALQPRGEVPVSGGPSALALNPDRNRLYVGHRNSNQLSTFSVDSSDGSLSLLSTIPLQESPTYLSTDRRGRFLLSSHYQGARVGVHAIGADGAAVEPPIEWITTDNGAHSILVDRSNRFAFVPHIARIADNVMNPPGDALGPNVIYQFRFDQDTGRLTPNNPAILELSEFLGPRHYCFHPTLDIAYFSDEQGSSVTGYAMDSDSGALSAIQTVSSLPDGTDVRNTCSMIQITADGKLLLVPNRGHNSIASFTVDSAGRLTPAGRASTERVPSAFSLDPQGKFVYAAGSESGRLASYQLNGDTGELTPGQVYDVGARPMWVLITP